MKIQLQRMSFVSLCFGVLMYLLLLRSAEGADNVRCRENERRALLKFKAGVVDEGGMLSSWGNSSRDEEECCNWTGIRCSNLTGHVTVLNRPGDIFPYLGLTGQISPSLSELKHLKYLNLGFNWFDGEIPPQLGNLTNLRVLDLSYSRYLAAESLNWASHLHLLTHLNLDQVNLSSCTNWLNQIYNLSFLTHLHLGDLPDQSDPVLPLINTSFSALNSLVLVDLYDNNFVSPRSYNWLFNFTTNLVSLFLSGTSFPRSEIPEAFGRITSLQSLSLFRCDLEGTLPESFRNLSHLDTLDLRFNNFNGSLSEFLYPLTTTGKNLLQVLKLDMNQLHGSLPDYFPRFSSLQELSISNNKLSGSFPENFWQISSSLVFLDLSHNQITGQLFNLTMFSSLFELDLKFNNLVDTIPEAYLSKLSNLFSLDLSYNSISLKFSDYWVPPFQVYALLLNNCTLGPRFPTWLRSQHGMTMLAISSAGISDAIPLWFWNLLPNLTSLNISHNNIQGTLPDLSFMSLFDYNMDMSSNNLTGPITRLPVNIQSLDLSGNIFTGSLDFLCITSYQNLVSIRLSDNQLSGELPDCWVNAQGLVELNLANNTFSGKLPASIGLLYGLGILQLRNNRLSGELPSSMMNCSSLELLDLSENELSGEVPTWIGTHLTYLVILSLSKNKFSGKIPSQICLLTYVQVVDLSRNNLSRSMPNCVGNFTALEHREDTNNIFMIISVFDYEVLPRVPSAYLQWKGQESLYGKNIGLLKLIDFSSNRLVGEIPEEFGTLHGLMSLNLSSNHLNGSIIPNIGQMNALEVLDLSENNLSGEIPASLSNLTFLSVLDLSNNNLTGKIPSSTQLQSFNSSSYAGNDKLCGLPLPNKCQNDVKIVFSQTDDDEHEVSFFTIWFYISLVLGFLTGFWGFVGPIMLRTTWRLAYYKFLEKITDWIYVTTSLTMARLQRKIYG